ncbi:MAG: hypothetical protein COV74_10715 [Candidatus Omnitrophica bacterium CG11_big_fil_rev_8_21_14_0_20_45_26]|uniref:diguanylate cyclase n=1 Tax=Candidatus Abzuiibacterium crystallinum TaxID=1974748 RepID=A0A2H0LKW4_9BACT|nr:MAG: hypothetical protein COV74_10715 [Candidatus Omnitrophica bacterium CG11_big_fil_rev_8_21_14_0_20_45_26]PIW63863.1 MAG: hypothetical protein COW12_08095 [Candidatus Omnitrophica bacterium CG12_big_fil_rev_8_21_14_0_65_45_16]
MGRTRHSRLKQTVSYQTQGIFLGILLGLGAPLGGFLIQWILHWFLTGSSDNLWIQSEFEKHSFFYTYMTASTPIVFSLFGYGLGVLLDRLAYQKQNLEVVNVVLRGQSISDDMTGLYNHRHMMDQADKELERMCRYARPLVFMMIDIDNFKSINDQYGHLTGDQILREMAFLLRDNVRKIDIVGRYGGDEFLVILPEATLTSAFKVAEKIREHVDAFQFCKPNLFLSMTLSVGLAAVHGDCDMTRDRLINLADQALLRAKRQGKNFISS